MLFFVTLFSPALLVPPKKITYTKYSSNFILFFLSLSHIILLSFFFALASRSPEKKIFFFRITKKIA